MFRLLALFLALSLSPAMAQGEWTLFKHEGRDYVTVANVGKFYQFGPVQQNGKQFSMRTATRSLKGHVGSSEFHINGVKFILSHPIAEIEGKPCISRMDLSKLLEPVLRPGRIANPGRMDTVILDPGHGGHDHGARSHLGSEKNYTLDTALKARDLLQKAGFRVLMTRSSDVFVPLEKRAAFASRYPNAIFISIHFNHGKTDASGVETFTLAPRGVRSMARDDGPAPSDNIPYPGHKRDAENIALACAMHATMVRNSTLFDRGIKRARFVVLRENATPAVLIEGGFLSNKDDARRIALASYRQQLAHSIVQAVQRYQDAVGYRPAYVAPAKPSGPVIITTPGKKIGD